MTTTIDSTTMERYQQELSEQGFLHIKDLPENIDHYEFAQQFGELMPQYDGRYLWSIQADPKFDDHYHSLNTKKLSPHTECYEYPGEPPRYLALWCVVPASCQGGQTTLMKADQYFSRLNPEDVQHLSDNEYTFSSSSGIQESALGRSAQHRILTREDDNLLIRFSANCIDTSGDQRTQRILEDFVAYFEDNHVAIHWDKGDFLIWDNRRVVHSRTEYSDRARELRRVWLN